MMRKYFDSLRAFIERSGFILNLWRVRLLIILCSLSTMCAALLFIVPRTFAIGQDQPSLQARADNQVCPLSDKQQEEAPKKFAEMMLTFTHPRCINCHGAVNPFAANTPHIGGRLGVKFTEVTRRDDILDRDVKIVVVDEENKFARCKDCHSAFDGNWAIPPPEDWFVGKTPIQLCKRMRRFASAGNFLDHIENDSGGFPFIEEAFKGTRALDDNGQATYLNETGKDFKPEPPPITRAQFVDQAEAWVDAMGGEFKGGSSCGCEPLHYAFKINVEEGVSNPGILQGVQKGQANLQIPTKFKEDGSFTGETQVNITYTGSYKSPDFTCTLTMVVNGQTWSVSGNDGDDKTLHIKLTVKKPVGVNKGVCVTPSGTVPTSANIPAGESSISFDLGAFVGETTPVTLNNQYGGFDNLQFSVVEQSTP